MRRLFDTILRIARCVKYIPIIKGYRELILEVNLPLGCQRQARAKRGITLSMIKGDRELSSSIIDTREEPIGMLIRVAPYRARLMMSRAIHTPRLGCLLALRYIRYPAR